MRILHTISSTNPESGGPVESLRQRVIELANTEHTLEVASLDSPSSPWLSGLPRGDFPCVVHALGAHKGRYGYSAKFRHWMKANARSFDAVVVGGLWQYHGFATRAALLGSATPYFVFTHGMLDPWFKQAFPLKHLKKCLYWPWGEYRVLRDARAVLFTAEEERLRARESFSLYSCRERVVGSGTAGPDIALDFALSEFHRCFPELSGKRLLLFLGRIHPKKGCDLLLRAFAAHCAADPALHLVMAGPDGVGWQAELQDLSQRLALTGRVSWLGMLSGALKWGAFAAAEAFVLPSHQENFGVAVAESLACATPVLISNRVNIWREVVADDAGFAENDDQEGTERLLARWLALSDVERQGKRELARACFERRFTVKQATARFIEVLVGSSE